jgi:hypothetical protein
VTTKRKRKSDLREFMEKLAIALATTLLTFLLRHFLR